MKKLLIIILLLTSCSKTEPKLPFQPPYNSNAIIFKTINGVLSADDRNMNLYALTMPVSFDYVDHFHVFSAVDDQILHPEYSVMKNNRRIITFHKTMYVQDGCFYEIVLVIPNTDQGIIK